MPIRNSEFKGLIFQSNPLLSQRNEITSYVISLPKDSASAYHPGRTLNEILINRNGQVETKSISDVDPKVFTSNVDLDAATEGLVQRLGLYKESKPYESFEIQTANPGDIIENLIIDPNQYSLFCLTNKQNSNYFDLVVYILDKDQKILDIVTYSNKTHGTMNHSGDVGSLFHGLKWSSLENEKYYVIGVNGFRKAQLKTFNNQLPCLIVAHETTIEVVPLDLAEAVCAQSTLAFLAVVTGTGLNGKVTCLSRQITVDDIDTGAKTQSVESAIQQVMSNYQELNLSSQEGPSPQEVTNVQGETVSHHPTEHQQNDLEEHPISQITDKKTLLFYEDGLPYNQHHHLLTDETSTLYLGFSCGLDAYLDQSSFLTNRLSEATTFLPLIGTIKGPAAALVRCSTLNRQPFSLEMLPKLIDSSQLTQFVVTDRWNRAIAQTVSAQCNGLFIMVPTFHKDIASSQQEIEKIMTSLNRDCLCMAGPNSIVLVSIDNELYWYRGVCWPGLVNNLPTFAEKVTQTFKSDSLKIWLDNGGYNTLPWPKYILLNEKSMEKGISLWFNGKKLKEMAEVATLIHELSFEELKRNQEKLQDLLTQTSIILGPAELTNLVTSFITQINLKTEAIISPINAKIKSLAAKALEDTTAKNQIASLIAQRRMIPKGISQFLSHLETLTSQRASSSKRADLNRIIRKTTIQNNVNRVRNMSRDDQLEYIASVEEWLITSLTPGIVNNLQYLGQNQPNSAFRIAALKQQLTNSSTGLLPRCPELDGITVSALVEQSLSHPLMSKNGVAVARMDDGVGFGSVLPIPMLPMFVDCKSPYGLAWTEITNLPEISTYRIALRSTICEATCTRDFNISPSSKELSFFLIHFFLTTARELSKCILNIPTFDSTICKMIRTLVGLAITTSASGQTPASEVFTLFGGSPKIIPENEVWIINILAEVMPYTGWDLTNLKKNLTLYCVKHIRRYVTDLLTDKLRRSVASMATVQHADGLANRQQELKCLEVAIPILFRIQELGINNVEHKKLIAARVKKFLPKMPPNPRHSTSTIVDFITNDSCEIPHMYNTSILEIATNIYTRCSAVYSEPKKILAGNIENQDGYEQIQMIEEKLKQYHANPKMQNRRSLLEKDQTGMKGDAEIKRKPFKDVQDILDQIFNSNPSESIALKEVSALKAIEEEVNTVVTYSNRAIVALTPHGGPALAFAKRINALTLDDLKFDQMEAIVNLIGLGQEHWQEVTEMLLTDWRDNVEAEQRIFKYISPLVN